MNGNLSSTESVADDLKNIPEIEIALFHERVLLFFYSLCVYNDTTIYGILSNVIWLLAVGCWSMAMHQRLSPNG